MSSSSGTPVRMPCGLPGKAAYLVWKTQFVVDDRYELLRGLGRGAYGIVVSARDRVSKRHVAIKKISAVFDNPIAAWRTLREVKLLKHLAHENVIGLFDIMRPAESDIATFADVYLVYELMDTDLHQIIRTRQELTEQHLQFFIYQVLKGLKYVHTANVLHRDLKPANLLLTAKCDLKICDFGLARTSSERNMMTEYVVTRWYRAPELLLSCDHYSAAIDIWSVGCILAELLRRKPLFPGSNYLEQLNLIVGTLGTPSREELGFVTQQTAHDYITRMDRIPRADFSKAFPGASSGCLSLLSSMLQFDPRRRIGVVAALEHPWLADLHDPATEATAPAAFEETDLELEKMAQAAETAAAQEAAALHKGDSVAAEASRKAVATEVSLVRQRMWETIQTFHFDAVGKPKGRVLKDITATTN